MRRCFRCGLDYDGSDYVPSAPCPDCQWDFPGEEFRKLNIVREQEAERRIALVASMVGGIKSDREIGEAIGLHVSSVRIIREKLGVATHQIPEGAKYGYRRR